MLLVFHAKKWTLYILDKIWQLQWQVIASKRVNVSLDGIVPDDHWVSVYTDEDNHWAVSGLDESSVYEFRVRAKNDFGWSEFSDPALQIDLEKLKAQKRAFKGNLG